MSRGRRRRRAAVGADHAEDVQGEHEALARARFGALAGAKDVAVGVGHFHGEAGPAESLKEAGEVQDLVAGAGRRLGGDGEGVVGVLVAGHYGLRRLDEMHDDAQVAGRLRGVVGWIGGGLL